VIAALPFNRWRHASQVCACSVYHTLTVDQSCGRRLRRWAPPPQRPTLRAARRRASRLHERPYLVQADACRLPFADAAFDVVFHFDGLNVFDEPEQALHEFARVARPGGIVAFGDWSASPNLPRTISNRILQLNPCLRRAPLSVPSEVLDERAHHWVLRQRAYLKIERARGSDEQGPSATDLCVSTSFPRTPSNGGFLER
jgi:ubiquinone/menaquinone biosynthesis C-methylase UbiE